MGSMTSAAAAAALRELKNRCTLKPAALKRALAESGGDVDAALLALIDSGAVESHQLNPRVVPDDLYVRAKKARLKAQIAGEERLLKDKASGGDWMRLILLSEVASLRVTLKTKSEFVGLRQRALDDVERMERIERDKRQRASHGKLKLPPLPPLKLEMDEWVGRDSFTPFKGFRADRGRARSSGAIDVEVSRLDDDEVNPAPPSPEQVAAYKHFKENDAKIAQVILKAVFKYVKGLIRDGFFDNDADDSLIPVLKSPSDLKDHMQLYKAGVLDYAKAGQAYIGLAFWCTWDEEHGLGVLLHKSRVVETGQADTSFDHFAAKDDGGKSLKPKPPRARRGRSHR
jgi:hypothetical protein